MRLQLQRSILYSLLCLIQMDLFDNGDMWYEAELARSGRSKCKEFRCKETIDEGELRIGIKTEEHDHGGDTLGWYHPNCLWKTFCYKSNANPRITKISDIVNYRSLEADELAVFTDLINKSPAAPAIAAPVAGVKRELNPNANIQLNVVPLVTAKGSVALSVAGDDLVVSGDTFAVKDVLKAAGGRWNGASKSWTFAADHHAAILAIFDLVEPLAPGQSKVLETTRLQSAAGVATGAPSIPIPKYAMAGTVVFKLVQNTQDIELRGNTGHIASRLRAAGGAHQTTQWAMAEYWKFSTQSRAGARKFLCMPDDLPVADMELEIDLAELGRKQAAADGATVYAEEQQAAEQLLRDELERQDAEVLKDARAALSALGWGKPAGEEGAGGRSKRARRGADVEAAAEPVGEVANPLPASVDALCYESRLDLSKFTISDYKARLAARGLPVSGTRDVLEARFLLAGAEYAPIRDLEEYTRLAKSRRLQLRYVIPTRAGDLIDALLARCKK